MIGYMNVNGTTLNLRVIDPTWGTVTDSYRVDCWTMPLEKRGDREIDIRNSLHLMRNALVEHFPKLIDAWEQGLVPLVLDMDQAKTIALSKSLRELLYGDWFLLAELTSAANPNRRYGLPQSIFRTPIFVQVPTKKEKELDAASPIEQHNKLGPPLVDRTQGRNDIIGIVTNIRQEGEHTICDVRIAPEHVNAVRPLPDTRMKFPEPGQTYIPDWSQVGVKANWDVNPVASPLIQKDLNAAMMEIEKASDELDQQISKEILGTTVDDDDPKPTIVNGYEDGSQFK